MAGGSAGGGTLDAAGELLSEGAREAAGLDPGVTDFAWCAGCGAAERVAGAGFEEVAGDDEISISLAFAFFTSALVMTFLPDFFLFFDCCDSFTRSAVLCAGAKTGGCALVVAGSGAALDVAAGWSAAIANIRTHAQAITSSPLARTCLRA